MNDIIQFCDSALAEELHGATIPDDLGMELDSKFYKGKILLEAQINIGHLLMSEKACKDLLSLNSVLSDAEQEDNSIRQIAEIRTRTEECLYTFIPHAKDDLGVQKV